jgi:SAM-dependent methyltransferase
MTEAESLKLENDAYVDGFTNAETLKVTPKVVDIDKAMPSNPPADLQQKFVGATYRDSYLEAQAFVNEALEHWPSGSKPGQAVLDFGSGWGRIVRMLLRDFAPVQLWASDVDSEMTALVQQTLPGVNAVTNPTLPPTAFRTGAFDVVTAFSVFSHLSERAHREWAQEFGRVVRKGGKAYITVLDDAFFHVVAGAQAALAAGDESGFVSSISRVLKDPLLSQKEYGAGKFIYGSSGADGVRDEEFYGWAAAPRSWMQKVWGRAGFTIESWAPTGRFFQQAMWS